jgi:hypothetical protein
MVLLEFYRCGPGLEISRFTDFAALEWAFKAVESKKCVRLEPVFRF